MERTPFTSFHIVVSYVWDCIIVFFFCFALLFRENGCFILAVFVLSTNNLYENFCENFCKSYVNDKVFEREIVCECVCVYLCDVVCCWKSSCKIKYPIKQARTTIMSAANLQKHFRPNKMNNKAMQQQPHTQTHTHHRAHQI